MNTLDRIRAVRAHYSSTTPPIVSGGLHTVLDALDRSAGLRTQHVDSCRCGRGSACNHGSRSMYQRQTVGQRLAHHEAKIANPTTYHFWLGEEG